MPRRSASIPRALIKEFLEQCPDGLGRGPEPGTPHRPSDEKAFGRAAPVVAAVRLADVQSLIPPSSSTSDAGTPAAGGPATGEAAPRTQRRARADAPPVRRRRRRRCRRRRHRPRRPRAGGGRAHDGVALQGPCWMSITADGGPALGLFAGGRTRRGEGPRGNRSEGRGCGRGRVTINGTARPAARRAGAVVVTRITLANRGLPASLTRRFRLEAGLRSPLLDFFRRGEVAGECGCSRPGARSRLARSSRLAISSSCSTGIRSRRSAPRPRRRSACSRASRSPPSWRARRLRRDAGLLRGARRPAVGGAGPGRMRRWSRRRRAGRRGRGAESRPGRFLQGPCTLTLMEVVERMRVAMGPARSGRSSSATRTGSWRWRS